MPTRQASKFASPLLYGQLWLAEQLVFRKLRARFGGRTRLLPVAGVRLADDVNLFFQAMVLNLKYGYGMTETTATVLLLRRSAVQARLHRHCVERHRSEAG